MKKTFSLIAALGLLLALNATAADEAQWTSLFNGKDLTGWVPVHDVTFEVVEGNLRLVKGMGWLRTEKEYQDYVLEFEWMPLDEQYDSGIFFRCIEEGKPWPKDGWQVNLKYSAVGQLVKGYKGTLPAEATKQPLNKWVKTRLEVKGKTVKLWINDEENWTYNEIDVAKGYIGIQAENKRFDFRNFRVKPLK
jgi:hypothetical protein